MPNHCSSDLRVNGKLSSIKEMFEKVKGIGKHDDGEETLIDAHKIIPYPAHLLELDRKAAIEHKKGNYSVTDGFNSGGYEWCIANWGTKWGLYNFSEVKFGKTFAFVMFETAWSPPLPIILRMSELFPDLTFTLKYYEQGAAFKGVYKVKAGEVLVEEETTYNGNRGG